MWGPESGKEWTADPTPYYTEHRGCRVTFWMRLFGEMGIRQSRTWNQPRNRKTLLVLTAAMAGRHKLKKYSIQARQMTHQKLVVTQETTSQITCNLAAFPPGTKPPRRPRQILRFAAINVRFEW